MGPNGYARIRAKKKARQGGVALNLYLPPKEEYCYLKYQYI